MLIGLVGAPNKGKSTIFSAMTLADAEIADYPFTTINPNLGVTYATKPCPDKELGVRCNPRNSLCTNGTRRIPVNVTDIAGLVPGAHLGKGMGTQFLNDVIAADSLVHVVDLSGETDVHGNSGKGFDQAEDVGMVEEEMANWLSGIIEGHMSALSRRKDGIPALMELLSGFGPTEEQIGDAAEESSITTSNIHWDHNSSYRFSKAFLYRNKSAVIAANKLDKAEPGALEALKKRLGAYDVVGCSGAIELALRKAAKSDLIDYVPGSSAFDIKEGATSEQRRALEYMHAYLRKNGTTGIQELVNESVFGSAGNIAVYPVENENRYTDHTGNALPDVLLMKRGSRAVDMAARIHTEIADKMLYAVDARSKRRLAKDYVLNDGDVIKIVSAAR